MQQSVRVKGVVNAAAPAARLAGHGKFKTDVRAALTNVLAVGVGLFSADAVLLRDVLGDLLALSGHVRVQLKRLKVDFGCDVGLDIGQRLVKRHQAYHAPGARNVRHKIDF